MGSGEWRNYTDKIVIALLRGTTDILGAVEQCTSLYTAQR